MKETVDFKRFLINLTKLIALVLITVTLVFALLSVNEQLAMGST